MLFIYDKSAVQGKVKWKIKDKDIVSGKQEITYISPGAYAFKTKDGKEISFDFSDSGSDLDKENYIITSELFSLDYDYINENLLDKGYDDMVKEEHRLELFRDFDEFIDIYCFTDVDGEEKYVEMECIYFELFDPITEEVLMLKGEKE